MFRRNYSTPNHCIRASPKARAPDVTSCRLAPLDNGAYDKRPCAKSEYFRVYAKTHACVKVVCPTCGRTLNKQELPGHQIRPICARRAAKIA